MSVVDRTVDALLDHLRD